MRLIASFGERSAVGCGAGEVARLWMRGRLRVMGRNGSGRPLTPPPVLSGSHASVLSRCSRSAFAVRKNYSTVQGAAPPVPSLGAVGHGWR